MDLKTLATEHLQHKLLPFWAGLRDDAHGGYFGHMGYDLRIDRHSPKGLILHCRILWFFSRAAAQTGDPAAIAQARHAYAFLPTFWDAHSGGYFWSCSFEGLPLDTTKHTYAQAFAIYALCAYHLATGEAEPLQQALAVYHLMEARMRDSLGYLEAFDRDFQPLDNAKLSDNPRLMQKGLVAEKTMNTMLHVLEAYTSLAQASQAADVAASLRALLYTIEHRVYDPIQNRLHVFMDARLSSILDMQSFGHDIEASWLIDLAARQVLPQVDQERVAAWTTALAQGVAQRAFQGGSLLNECVEGEMDSQRIWWVQAETMVGFVNLYAKTGERLIREAMDSLWQYIMNTMVDARAGSEWFWAVDAQGTPLNKPMVEPWKCPYHNGRMCLELMARL
ncbi:MAG: AGE family epimerase/isomerase [Candidatus Limiplasma sp.]|nr:AGE family epimerase/isomerase [Candidatus Limiplasma sp.]MEA5144670.1 AGE family epimerase/isomerase [Candidatus Limiplasma sp.]